MNSASAVGSSAVAESSCDALPSEVLRWWVSAHGTTTSDTIGAAAMPSATNDSPDATPATASTANMTRAQASKNTSAP